MAIAVKPTRSELIALKKKIKLAKSGFNLLKKKRDGLILEFFEVLKKVKESRSELTTIYQEALYKMSVTRSIETDLSLKSLALAAQQQHSVSIEEKNVMGLRVPRITAELAQTEFLERGYGVLSSSVRVDEVVTSYQDVLEKVVKAAEVEITLKKLLREIERTKRKVNALEQIVIPQMEKAGYYVRMRLEEMERENFSRLKLIKRRI